MRPFPKLLAFCALSLPLLASAEVEPDPAGEYRNFAISPEGDSYAVTGCCSEVWTLEAEAYSEASTVYTLTVWDKAQQYFPDEEAYPVTYIAGRYRGNPEMVEKYHVVDFSEEKRIAIVGDWMYLLSDFEGPDSYVIDGLLRQGTQSGFANFKETFQVALKNPGPERQRALQDYLEQGFAKQAELVPAWRASHQQLIADRVEGNQYITDFINNQNRDYSARLQARDAAESGSKDSEERGDQASTGRAAQTVPRIESCPNNYSASGDDCVPNANARYATVRDGGCPSGSSSSGNYCLDN